MIGQLAAFDHWRQRVVLVDNVVVRRRPVRRPSSTRAPTRRRGGRVSDCCAGTARGPCRRRPGADARPPRRACGPRRSPDDDLGAATAARSRWPRSYIEAGDIFQVVLSQRYDLDLGADPFDVYRALRLLNPSPYLYFLRFHEVTVVGSSPEPMVRLRDGVVDLPPDRRLPAARARPSEEDDFLAGELVEDPKELAEHVMLVDLARNDVGRVVALRHRSWSTSS